jgi:glycosyltransferase involved in cell wall biosynthesis
MERERERWPEWSSTIPAFRDSEEKLERKDQELLLSKRIFVASKFTASTLNEFPAPLPKIEVVPYGFPPVAKGRRYQALKDRPLRILFIGGLSQRKGIADLFAVSEKLKQHVELTIVGKKSTADCKALNTALSKTKWIPTLPHDQILKLMQKNDVMVFPSLFEGFGLVISEAM